MTTEPRSALNAFHAANRRDANRTLFVRLATVAVGEAAAITAFIVLDGPLATVIAIALMLGAVALTLPSRPVLPELERADRALGDMLAVALSHRGYQVEGEPVGRLYLSKSGKVRAADPNGTHVIVRARQRDGSVDFDFTPTERLTMVNA